MQLELQAQLHKDVKMARFLKENSYWYKELNRNPDNYKKFVSDMKVKYKLRTTDKISSMIDNIDLIGTVLQTLK